MRNLFFLECFIIIITCNSNLYCKSDITPTPGDSNITDSIDSDSGSNSLKAKYIEFGFKGLSFDYKEVPPDTNQYFKSEESGFLPGIYGILQTNKYFNFYISALVSYNFGKQRYEGGIQSILDSTYEPFGSDHHASYFLFNLCLNYNINTDDGFAIIPYIVFEDRTWDRDMSTLTHNGSKVGYEEVYKWSYLGLGFSLRFDISSIDVFTLSGKYNLMFSGKMKAYLSDVSPGAPNLDFILGNGEGLYGEMTYKHIFSKKWAFSVSSFIEKYSFIKSDYVYLKDGLGNTYQFLEPSSNSNAFSFNIGVIYSLGK
jgi:hypothetical protein